MANEQNYEYRVVSQDAAAAWHVASAVPRHPSRLRSYGGTMNDDLLTEAEHEAMALSGQLANALRRVIGDGPQAENDWSEAAQRIHAVQHMILSQAAARAYPDRYRLLGGTLVRLLPIPETEEQP